MFHHYPDMNFDGKKDWFDGFLFHEMIREIEEKDGRGTPRKTHTAAAPTHSVIDDDLDRLEQQMLKEKR